MSAFNLRNIREISNDPLTKFTNEIAKKLSAFLTKDSITQLDDQEDIYADGQDIDSVVKFHDNFESTNKFDNTHAYYPAFEPDGDKLRLWVRGRSIGNTLRDYSTYNQVCELWGDPILVDGTPFDDGTKTGGNKSIALRFFRPEAIDINNIIIKDDTLIRAAEDLSTGVSFFMRFRVFDIAQEGGENRTLFEKTDNNPVDDSTKLEIDAGGRLKFQLQHAGTIYTQQTDIGVIDINTVYDVWCTWAIGEEPKIYVNGSSMPLFGTSPLEYHGNLDNFDWYLMRRGSGPPDNGLVYGDLYDFRIYREKVVTAAEVGYMYTNKWTISNIPYGQVMIANYFAAYEAPTPSFTSTSFTSSFDL